jgi:hypothetical protein
MRLRPAVIPAVALLLLAIAGGAAARPHEAELGRLTADGPVTLASNKPGVALLHADAFKPGDSVSGTLSLTNDGDGPGELELGATGLRDVPGAHGGLLSHVLRLRVEDLGGGRPPLEAALDRASTFALGSLRGGETRSYRVTATFPDGGLPLGPAAGDNLQQGSSVQVALQWQLTAAEPAPTATPTLPVPPVATPTAPPAVTPRRPRLTLRVLRQRVLKPRGITAFAACEVACRVRITARTDTAPRGHKSRRTLQRKRVLRGERRWRTLRTGREQRIILQLSRKALARLKRRLQHHRAVGITITADMRTAAGNRTARRRIVVRRYRG